VSKFKWKGVTGKGNRKYCKRGGTLYHSEVSTKQKGKRERIIGKEKSTPKRAWVLVSIGSRGLKVPTR